MCGIFGFIGNIPERAREDAYLFLKHLFIQSNIRGKDASGFAAVHRDSPLIVSKRAVSSNKFVFACSRFRALKNKMPTHFIGHTRAYTSGHPSRGRNNHPFNSQRYSLVHNGTIDKWESLVHSHNIQMRTETDSEVIIRLIDEKDDIWSGIQYMVDTVERSSRIAIAVLKHDEVKDRRLFLFRTNNPIYVATAPAWRAIFFASTDTIIENALKASFGQMVWHSKKAALEMEIEPLPTWRVAEFIIDDNSPHLASTKDIKEPPFTSNQVMLPAPSTSRLDNVLPNKSINGLKPFEMSASSTPRVDISPNDNLSPATKADLEQFNKNANRVARLLNTISSEPFMTFEEIEDWKEWLRSNQEK